MVPKAGLEPARRGLRLILSQVRLPIPPLRHIVLNNSNIISFYNYTVNINNYLNLIKYIYYNVNIFFNMKGISSRILREEFSWLKSRLPTLWTNSYFVSTVGGSPISIIKQYIESQKRSE